jgi:hypothetical protein
MKKPIKIMAAISAAILVAAFVSFLTYLALHIYVYA